MNTTVCIATLRRNEGLRRLLEGINALEFSSVPEPDLHIIVVDNDPAGGAASVCKNTRSRWPITHLVETRRGIPFARNRALHHALQSSQDAFVFIDDDEVPTPHWLDELSRVYHEYHADVVSGPVLPSYPEGVEPWILRGGFFTSKRYPTGTEIPIAYTNNVLVAEHVIRSMDSLFTEKWPLNGGDDSHFFTRVARRGFKFVWADEAIVQEWIPASRANWRWMLMRTYRTGNSRGLMEVDLASSAWPRLACIAKGVVYAVGGVIRAPLMLFTGKHEVIRSLRATTHGLGMISGALGHVYREYSTIHSADRKGPTSCNS